MRHIAFILAVIVCGCGSSVENGYQYRIVIDDGRSILLVGPPMGSHDNGLGGLPGQYSQDKYYFLDKWGDRTCEMKSHCRLYKRKSSGDDWEETR